jgi:hypothetical protein
MKVRTPARNVRLREHFGAFVPVKPDSAPRLLSLRKPNRRVVNMSPNRVVEWACGPAMVAVAIFAATSRGADLIHDPSGKTTSQDKATIDLFDGMKSGEISVKYIAHNSGEGQLLVTNKGDQPLTVKLPDAFAAVPVLAQAVNGAGNGAANNGARKSYNNNNNNNQNQGLGGGGFGGGGGYGGGLGGGAFDVPPEKTAKVRLETVCLEHGKKEPNPRVPYEIRPIDTFTSDANVQELCKLLGTGQISHRAAQAAAWHLANHMSWEQLMDKRVHHLIGGDENYFTREEILAAMQITDRAMKAAEARAAGSSATTSPSVSTSAGQK